jgi:alkanesulfonate monooxygenase SsuD/methylene tetrahydromethanopterin reductase-like flavin-dependent oxidoreductase (luciferase family)
LAARCGTSFCQALFLGEGGEGQKLEAIDLYEAEFSLGGLRPRPVWSVAVAGVCAETDGEARRQVEAWKGGPRASVVGRPDVCEEILMDTAAKYRTNEVVFLNMSVGRRQQRESLALLAEQCHLKTVTSSPKAASRNVDA